MGTPSLLVLLGGIGAALVAGWLSQAIKLAEFRQAWINDLRKDIADYIGLSQLWCREYDRLNNLKKERCVTGDEHGNLWKLENDVRIILCRIKMRFKPRNTNASDDEKLIDSLNNLISPGKLNIENIDASWVVLAEQATDQARRVLKIEWEVVKKPIPHWLWNIFGRLRALSLTLIGKLIK